MRAALLLALLALPAAASSEGPDAAAARREYLQGTLHERRGAYAEALQSYERALKLDPGSAFLAGEAAELALELRDWERAERWARKRLELAPADGKSQLVLAKVLWGRGREDEAVAAFQAALKLDPSSLDAIMALTELLAPREPKRARTFLESFMAANPSQRARILHELGKLDASEGRFPQAVKELRESIALDDSESDEVRMTLGQVFEVTRDTAAAIVEYRKVLAVQPDDWELWAHVASLEAARGDMGAARAEFARLKERKPDDPAACAWLASDAERAGDYRRAAGYLKDSAALKAEPTLALRLSYDQLQAGDTAAAVGTLEEARKRWPKDDRVAYYLALGRDDRGEHAEAAKLLREVLAVKPEDREARWQLAVILERAGRLDEAEPEFRRLLAGKPDDAAALNYLGYALAERGQKLNEAESLARRAVALEPSNPAYRDSLGWALFKQGKAAEALVELERAARSLPDDETLWDHLGDARKSAGREEGAWRAWRLAQSLGAPKAGAKADALEKGLKPAAAGELWRSHLAALHGGLKRYAALCALAGKILGKPVERKALLTFRAPEELSFELLGPLFSTAWRARLDSHGFAMDRFPAEGLDERKAEEAARAAFEGILAALGGGAWAPGASELERPWRGGPVLARPAWRTRLDGGRAGALERAGGDVEVALGDWWRARSRQWPRRFEAKGRGWDLSVTCAEPKADLDPAAPAPGAD